MSTLGNTFYLMRRDGDDACPLTRSAPVRLQMFAPDHMAGAGQPAAYS
jgi:hypothetical protein